MSDPAPVVTIGGIVIPFSHFSMTGGAYGSVGHVSITTSLTILQQMNVDLFTLTSGSPGFIEVSINVSSNQPEIVAKAGSRLAKELDSNPNSFTYQGVTYGPVMILKAPGTIIAKAGSPLANELDSNPDSFTRDGVTYGPVIGAPPTRPFNPPSGSTKRIFGGEYVNTDYNLDQDTVQIHARDWAGVLVDQKRVLTKIGKVVQKVLAPLAPGRVTVAGISNENQQVSNIITSIAAEFGFTPILHLSSSGRNPTVGTLYGSEDQSFLQTPQSLWSILNSLARDTGYNVYVTPNKELVFGEAGAGLDTINLSWNTTPQPGQMPCRNTRFQHHPRRNSTFRVLVMSYDPSRGQSTLGRATYIGNNYAGQHGLVAGMATGQAAVTADSNIRALQSAGARLGVAQIPLYSFHLDGLTADQAELRAESIATDIAKRELILATTIDGLPSVLPTQKIRVSGDLPAALAAPTYYVSGYEQTFSLPSGQSHGADTGWVTRITALNIPTESLDATTDRSQKGTKTRAAGSKSSAARPSAPAQSSFSTGFVLPGLSTVKVPPRKEG